MTDDLAVLTTSQLTTARATDFARLIGLQAKFAHLPDPGFYALRNFGQEFPRSLHLDLIAKAAVAAGSTSDVSWAGPVVQTHPLSEGFISLVRAAALIGRLGLRKVPMLGVSLPVETTATSAFAWLGEGLPKPLSAGAFSTLTLPTAKVAGLIALSDEVLKFAAPGTDAAVRDVLVAGCQAFVDQEFCDQTIASTAARPGGLANGSPTAAASGTTLTAAATDIRAMITSFQSVNPNLGSAQFVMSPSVAITLADAFNSQTLLESGGSLRGIPVATSAVIGNKVLLFDKSQVVYGDDATAVRIEVSREANLQFDSAPSDPTTSADLFQSLWQRGLVAFKTELAIRWRLARLNAARTLTGIAYA